jgi:hypothetical protein
LKKLFPVYFFSAAWHPRIFATPFAKKCTPSFVSYQPENPFPVLFSIAVFSIALFGTSLLNPPWRVPGFMEGGRGETDNERSNPILLPLVPEFKNI